MAISTIQEVIDRGSVSIYLSGNDNAKGQLFGKRLASPGSPISIALIDDALNWGYDGGAQTDADVRQMANYLEWLIGKYGQEAQYILTGSGGGSVTPIIPGGSPTRLDFIVSASSFLPTGTITYTFPTTWSGKNMDFIRGGVPQSTISTESSYFTWDRTTRIFTCSPALQVDELISIIPS